MASQGRGKAVLPLARLGPGGPGEPEKKGWSCRSVLWRGPRLVRNSEETSGGNTAGPLWGERKSSLQELTKEEEGQKPGLLPNKNSSSAMHEGRRVRRKYAERMYRSHKFLPYSGRGGLVRRELGGTLRVESAQQQLVVGTVK